MSLPLIKTAILTCALIMLCFLLGCVSWLIKGRVWKRTSCGRDPNASRADPACREQICDLCGPKSSQEQPPSDV